MWVQYDFGNTHIFLVIKLTFQKKGAFTLAPQTYTNQEFSTWLIHQRFPLWVLG